MPTKRLPALDSFDYEYLIYQQRRRNQKRKDDQRAHRRQLIARALHRLADAMSFLNDPTIQRGMQLELH